MKKGILPCKMIAYLIIGSVSLFCGITVNNINICVNVILKLPSPYNIIDGYL